MTKRGRERGVAWREVGSIRHRPLFQHFRSIDRLILPRLIFSFSLIGTSKWLSWEWTLPHVHERWTLDLYLLLLLLHVLLLFPLLFFILRTPKNFLQFWKHNILVKAPLFSLTFSYFLFHFFNIYFLSCMLWRLLFGTAVSLGRLH